MVFVIYKSFNCKDFPRILSSIWFKKFSLVPFNFFWVLLLGCLQGWQSSHKRFYMCDDDPTKDLALMVTHFEEIVRIVKR
jgi:hypothetical protein